MRKIFNKIILAIILLPVFTLFTNITFGWGQIANAVEPTVKLQSVFTSDIKVKDVKTVGNIGFLWGEDGKVYWHYQNVSISMQPDLEFIPTPTEFLLEEGEQIRDIVGSGNDVFVITNKNTYAIGNNRYGNLGLDELKIYLEFTKINIPGIIKIKTKGNSTWFITEQYTYAVGSNSYGELGIGSTNAVTSPQQVKVVEGVKDIITQSNRTWFITNTDTYAVGINGSGSLGIGVEGSISTPQKVVVSNVKKIYTNDENYKYDSNELKETYFLTTDGEVYACGWGYLGVGESSTSTLLEPKIITKHIEEPIIDIATYGEHDNIMITENNTYKWGYNSNDVPTAINILKDKKVVKITSDNEYHCCITEEGGIYNIYQYNSSDKIVTEYTDDILRNDIYVKDGQLYWTASEQTVNTPYINKIEKNTYEYRSGDFEYVYIHTVEGLYSVELNHANLKYSDRTHFYVDGPYLGANLASQISEEIWLGKNGEAYAYKTNRDPFILIGKVGEGIESYKDGYYFGLDGTVYMVEHKYTGNDGEYQNYFTELIKVGIQPWPRKDKVIIEDLASSAVVRYAFSTSDTYEGVTLEEWKMYDKDSGELLLNPPASGIYYLHIEITQDDTIYKYVFGPYEVKLNGDTINAGTSKTDYAYMSADMRIPDAMTATFNVIFTPPQDIFLTNTLNADPKRMFFGIIKNGNINIKVYDSAGNDISDRMDSGYVYEIYKNGVFVGHVSDNYLFTKRDEGAMSDNVYILKLNVGGANLFTGVGNQYKLEFNGMSGYDSVTMQNLVPINTHKFTLNVYVTELPNLT